MKWFLMGCLIISTLAQITTIPPGFVLGALNLGTVFTVPYVFSAGTLGGESDLGLPLPRQRSR